MKTFIPSRLLAKSVRYGEPLPASALLPQHLDDVYCSACAVLDATGDEQLAFVGLNPGEWSDRMRRIMLLAAITHDIGKANDHFQVMIQVDRSQQQGLRHEWVSYLILLEPEMQAWLAPAILSPDDYAILLWSVCGHHREPPPARSARGSEMRIYWSHDDFKLSLDLLATRFDLGRFPCREDESWKLSASPAGNVFTTIQKSIRQQATTWTSMSDADHRLAAACKACLIAADAAGSALAKRLTLPRRQRWVRAALKIRPTPEQIHALVKERLEGKPLRPFQCEVAKPENRVILVRAGCGTGKTVAAYNRAATRFGGRRIYFCYPTTGTATEGFRGYLFDAEARRSKLNARLFHGRASVDREMILKNRGDEDAFDAEARAESLEAWSTPIVCCTADTVLGLLQNHRRGLFTWPALAQAAFIFDEIHAYPDLLFAALLRFLGSLRGAPVLLMTASLPGNRRDAIISSLRANNESLAEVAGPIDLETLPRYRLVSTANPLEAARSEWKAGGNVLWVCNTVDRAMDAARSLNDLHPLVYHSRFRYEDRVARHDAVVAAFDRANEKPAIAVCTQVAEMSLDLSATMLVIDLAPVPAMIQRLGRLNRWALPPRDGERLPPTKPFLVVEPLRNGQFASAPYDPKEYGEWWTVSRQWLAALGTDEIRQADLAEKWQLLDTGTSLAVGDSTWLDGGPITTVGDLREPSPGITVILAGRDAADVASGRKAAVRVALPMPQPRGQAWRNWSRVKGWLIAPESAVSYEQHLGGTWKQ